MTSREIIVANIEYRCDERIGFNFAKVPGRMNDFASVGCEHGIETRRWREGPFEFYTDIWGNLWKRMPDRSEIGEVHKPALQDWGNLDSWRLPDLARRSNFDAARELAARDTGPRLHVPETSETIGMIDERFISEIHKPFWLLNTARGKCVKTRDLVTGLQSGKVLGAGLDVLEYEKASFESLFQENQLPAAFKYLIEAQNVLLTPHVAGWTVESKEKLARTIVEKVKAHFNYD